MKIIFLFIMLQTAVFNVYAQRHDSSNLSRREPVNPAKDKQEYQGYTIRLLPPMPLPGTIGSYGFDILKDNKLLVHQIRNPLLLSPNGIQKKDDAYKIAQWMIQEYKFTGHWQNMMPPHIAHDLKIETH